MLVLVNGIHAKTGGGVTYLRDLLPELASLPDVELALVLHKDQFDLFYPVDERIRVVVLRFPSGTIRSLVWEQLSIPILARSIDADVVFSPANFGPLLARRHVILLRNAVSVFNIVRGFRKKAYWAILTAATYFSLMAAKRSIAVSGYAKSLFTISPFKRLDRKIHVVPHGTRRFAPTVVPAGARRPRFLFAVSDIYVQKNYHTLLHAFADLLPRFSDLHLAIAGKVLDHDYMDELRTLCARLDIEQHVEFLGHVGVDRLCELYRECQVFVFPSLIETFGNPLVEAMAQGAPIACSNVAAMPEVIGDAGLMFDPSNAKDMARQIETLLADDALRDRLGRAAFDRSRGFTWAQTAQSTAQVFRTVVPVKRLQKPRHPL